MSDQIILIHLYETSSTAPCPQCGTPGSRIHSRYQRTIADVAFGRRHLLLKLLVRKWICRETSCTQRIFAERFPGLVRRYARMTDRLVEALQAVGVTTNGADAARILEALGMPTSAKTVIRHVLRLPLPSEGSVHEVGIDEWAWKKGHQYGTILVNLSERRIVQLLADRSVETSKAWLRTHPEIRIVSRDRGKLFREAATDSAPQAQQVVDRFHLQKNFAEALEKFLRHKTRVLKAGARSLAGKARPTPRRAAPKIEEQERRARHRQRVAVHKRVWKLYREGYHKEQIAQRIGISSQSVYRILKQEAAPPPRQRSRSHSILDPYLSYLSDRWNQGCHKARQLYEEIVAQGYTGSRRTLEMRLRTFRPNVAHPVSKQTITLEKPPSARSTALMIVRPVQNRTPEQTAYLAQLIQSDATIESAFQLSQDFGHLLRKREGLLRLEQWKAAVRASGIVELIAFVDGLADDAEAVANGCSMTWSNGMVEGFVNKVKAIKRSSYGQAGFALLQRRVLLHPTERVPLGKEQVQRSFRKSVPPVHQDTSGSRSTPTARAKARIA